MRRFLIVANAIKEKSVECVNRIAQCIKENNGESQIIWLSYGSKIEEEINQSVLGGVELVIVVGGDGTVIWASRVLLQYQVPMIGVNAGTVGFLCDMDETNIEESMERIFKDDYFLESRMLLAGRALGAEDEYALNDIAIYRGGNLRVISIELYLNGKLINTYTGDGIVISTPTGSTGYSLSCGGPIVDPSSEMIIVTPIASHSLSARSMVLEENVTIELRPVVRHEGEYEDIRISFDGDKTYPFTEYVRIKRGAKRILFLRLRKTGFLDILRQKLQDNN